MGKITGSRFYFHRERFITTGDLKSFDLMMRHYEAGGFVDISAQPGRRRRSESCIHPLAPAVGVLSEFSETTTVPWRWEGCKLTCEVHLCDICVSFFVRHTVLQDCSYASWLGHTIDEALDAPVKSPRNQEFFLVISRP